jgi:hypothetical protein
MAFFGQGQDFRTNPLLAQIQAASKHRQTGERIGQVRGRHLIDWVPTYQQWLTEGREDDALKLLLEIIEAAEKLAKVDGVAPPTGYTRQAADLYRQRGDEDAELAVLERYAAACPPGAGDPAILDRLEGLRTTPGDPRDNPEDPDNS